MIKKCYTYDDILLVPNYSDFFPIDANVETKLTPRITLKVPLISAAMDTVTESEMAIKLAQLGGIGCIHKNMTPEKQAQEVSKVKKHESLIVSNPVTIAPSDTIQIAIDLQKQHCISGIPVICPSTQNLVGIVTNRDVRFAKNLSEPVSTVMTSKNLITVNEEIGKQESLELLHKYRIERLIVIDTNGCCTGLITVKDMERLSKYPDATKDSKGRLMVAAAIGTAPDTLQRVELLVAHGVDVLIVDTAHGHSLHVCRLIREIRKVWPNIEIVGGNVVTAKGAKALVEAGVDGVKVGMGPGSICTTRIVTGAGVPQFSAILDVKTECIKHGVTLIADGGIKNSGDIAKSIAAGADVVMLGSLFAGTLESPGDIVLYQGRSYKSYRGMGSLSAMACGSADRYFQNNKRKLVAEGIEGMIPFKGDVLQVVEQLVGGLKSAMGYTGNPDIKSMQTRCEFVQVTSIGAQESKTSEQIISLSALSPCHNNGISNK